MVNGRDFHGEWSRCLLWMVEIFLVNAQDFHDEWSRFSWWMVEIFMVNGWDFCNERSRFLWQTVLIFMMNGKGFYHERSRFSWWQVQNCLLLQLKTWSAREASRHSPVMDDCSTISHKCYPYLPSRWVLLFVSGVGGRNEHAGWMNLRLYLFASGFNQRNEGGKWVQDFLLLTQKFESFSPVFSRTDATLGDSCVTWEHLRIFWEMKSLQGCSNTLWLGI